jgi:2-ketocyclohexanecarboxyl-CoA hydrolase
VNEIAFSALALYYGTEESEEGQRAFLERRPPRFRKPKGN